MNEVVSVNETGIAPNGEAGEDRVVFVRGKDGNTYALSRELLEAFELKERLLVNIGGRNFAIPEVVVKQQASGNGSSDAIDDMLDKQAFPTVDDGEEIYRYLGYTACFYGAWAGGGNAVAAGDYCKAEWM